MSCLCKHPKAESLENEVDAVLLLIGDNGRRLGLDETDLQNLRHIKASAFPGEQWSHLGVPPAGKPRVLGRSAHFAAQLRIAKTAPDTIWVRALIKAVKKKRIMNDVLHIKTEHRGNLAGCTDFHWFCGNFGNYWDTLVTIATDESSEDTADIRSQKISGKIAEMGRKHSKLTWRTDVLTDHAIWKTIEKQLTKELRAFGIEAEALSTWVKFSHFVVEEMFASCVYAVKLLQQESDS